MVSIDERSLNDELLRILKGQKSSGVIARFSDPTKPISYYDVTQPEQVSVAEEEEATRGSRANDRREQESRTFGLDKRIKDRIKWEDYLIGLLLQNPGLWPHVCGIINDGDFAGTDTRELYHIFNSVHQRDSSPLFQSFEQFVPPALLETVARARKSVETGALLDGAGLVRMARQCATRLKRARLIQSNTELQYLVRGAAEAGDSAVKQQLQRQLLDIHRQLRTIDSAMHLQG